MLKIYSDDPQVNYKNTSIDSKRTKAEIDALLGYWQVSDVMWHWKPEENDVYIQFLIEETIDDMPMKVGVKVSCPIIWDKERPRARPPQSEMVNWNMSMRAMWWFIKTHLEMAYAMQSSKTVAFLPYIQGRNNTQLKDVILQNLQRIQEMPALTTERAGRIIEVPSEQKGES